MRTTCDAQAVTFSTQENRAPKTQMAKGKKVRTSCTSATAFLRASPRLTPSSRRVNAASQLYDIFLITLRSLQVENNDSNKPIPTRLKNLDKDDDENLPPLRMQLESTTKALASMLQSSARCVEQSALLQSCEHAQQVQTVNEVRDNALPVMCEVP